MYHEKNNDYMKYDLLSQKEGTGINISYWRPGKRIVGRRGQDDLPKIKKTPEQIKKERRLNVRKMATKANLDWWTSEEE